jgi:hypothetical protein
VIDAAVFAGMAKSAAFVKTAQGMKLGRKVESWKLFCWSVSGCKLPLGSIHCMREPWLAL